MRFGGFSRYEIIAALGYASCVVGCSTKVEIVASAKSDGGLRSGVSHAPCQPGEYSGKMYTTGDGGLGYSGDIGFQLTQSLSGEIRVVDNMSTLQGMGTGGSSFEASIVGGSLCAEGSFETQLTDGHYKFYTTADHTAPEADIPFEGSIEGTYYDSNPASFTGYWDTVLHFPGVDYPVSGRWGAILLRSVP